MADNQKIEIIDNFIGNVEFLPKNIKGRQHPWIYFFMVLHSVRRTGIRV